MTAGRISKPARLYTPRLLGLSAQLADFPLDDSFALRASARSRTCGSTIELGCDIADDSSVARIGMQVSACAVGQSSAAIMARSAVGRTPNALLAMEADIARWLETGEARPDWPEFDALDDARAYPARHDALLLGWKAMTIAMGRAV